jgi:hypothetical protein
MLRPIPPLCLCPIKSAPIPCSLNPGHHPSSPKPCAVTGARPPFSSYQRATGRSRSLQLTRQCQAEHPSRPRRPAVTRSPCATPDVEHRRPPAGWFVAVPSSVGTSRIHHRHHDVEPRVRRPSQTVSPRRRNVVSRGSRAAGCHLFCPPCTRPCSSSSPTSSSYAIIWSRHCFSTRTLHHWDVAPAAVQAPIHPCLPSKSGRLLRLQAW